MLVGAAIVLPHRRTANPDRLAVGSCLLALKLMIKLLKQAVPERRPNGENSESFPSEHAAECVAAAIIIQREFNGQTGALASGLAATVSMARVISKKHHPRDVFAGAIIGSMSVWLTLQAQRAIQQRMLFAA